MKNKLSIHTIFRLQHPENLISRLFILEYMRNIDILNLYEKANIEQKKQLFYKFIDEESNTEQIDINWEFCLFEATLIQLEFFMKNFIEEIEELDSIRKNMIIQNRELLFKQEINKPADINLYDIARSQIEQSRNKIIGV